MDIFAQLIKDLGNKPRGNLDDLLKNIGSTCNIPRLYVSYYIEFYKYVLCKCVLYLTSCVY